MSETQPRVTQEGEGKVGMTTDASEAPTQRGPERGEIRCADVREFTRLDVAPDLFDGVELRRIGGQPFDGEPPALPAQIPEHAAALVAAEAIPDQDDAPAGEMAFERLHERDEDLVGVAPGVRLKEEAAAAAVPPKRQGPGDGQAGPMSTGVRQDGRLAARGPRAPADGLLGDTAFVLEDEPRVLAAGVFFRVAQRRRFHHVIAASSRSRACRAGRWSNHPKARSTRQTWPG